jgi:hypothetical protein
VPPSEPKSPPRELFIPPKNPLGLVDAVPYPIPTPEADALGPDAVPVPNPTPFADTYPP